MLESQHMGENQEETSTCSVCGGECRIQATMCDKCETALRGWIHDYPVWIHALREFLDSTAHYGGHQPGRVNLPSAPTPIRLSVVDHLQEIEDAVEYAKQAPFPANEDALVNVFKEEND